MKWFAPILVYLTVGLGLFWLHSAWGALLGFHFAILFSLLIARPNIPLAVLIKNTDIKWLLLSILLCGSSGVILYFLWPYIGLASGLSMQIAALGLNTSTQPMFIAYFAAINPFVEEYFWRGYLGSQTKGPYVSDFLYAGFHALILIDKVQISSVIVAVTVLTLAGWFWRQIAREDQGGLLGPVLGHMAADFTILTAVFLHIQH
jgi:membrane protease YdiL (CAAX protease family)